MVKVKIGDTEYEASAMPIIITAEKTYSQQIIIFYINGNMYKGWVSEAGRLVVNRPKE